MSLPSNNNTFLQGDFSGYQVQGRCYVVPGFDYHSPFSNSISTIKPFGRGHCFALLDDPRLVDANGSRSQGAGLAAVADTSAFQFDDAFTGMTTTGIDGALLEASNVDISVGEALEFRWCFLCYDTAAAGNNDFAIFDAVDGANLTYRKVLAQANDLAGGGITTWSIWRWQPSGDFHGDLRWVVSNGTTQNPPVPNASNRARPSALLIDTIRIVSV